MRQCVQVAVVLVSLLETSSISVSGDEPSETRQNSVVSGPQTEHRFPPLTVPEGFQATLFACDPLIEYPSVIAVGPRPGTLFVAHDYLTGLGVQIVRSDEVRLIEDTDHDGYADRTTVYASGFNSIQGLAFHDGNVFVMHAPLLTRLRDADDDGVADERKDLIEGLGLPPEENDNRLHCANGVTVGYDGWLYLALGDRGCDVTRPEGDRLLFQQGGILRCRMDGTDLHVYSTGLRNIYDVALDENHNTFVRDNENDGGDYMIRVCHCFYGSDHGYPYHYYERPAESMRPLADLGRGSSAGGTSYLETAFPLEYRDSLFFCEWGRGVVRYQRSHAGSSFAPMTETDFAIGAQNDPYGFKPTDLVVDYDGSMLISDWCDGQRPKRGRGRIYRISYTKPSAVPYDRPHSSAADTRTSVSGLIKLLDSDSYHQRVRAQLQIQQQGAAAIAQVESALRNQQLGYFGRLHSVWLIAGAADAGIPEQLFVLARSDPDARVRAQAIRAIGDLADPDLRSHRLDSGRGQPQIATRIADIAMQNDPRVVLESLIVMRRLRWAGTPAWIAAHLPATDPALEHAAQQALRNAGNWPAVIELLDGSSRVRKLALQAMAEQRESVLADQLIQRLSNSPKVDHRRELADTLTRIVRRQEPWSYWGFRPAPRPASTVDWEKTAQIESALNAALMDSDFDLRVFVLERMQREAVTIDLSYVAKWLRADRNEQRIHSILKALTARDASETQPLLTQVVSRSDLKDSNRLTALTMLIKASADNAVPLVQLTTVLDDGPVLAAVLREIGRRPALEIDELLLQKLDSEHAAVRAESIRALGIRKQSAAREHLERLLKESNSQVRLAAVEAAGQLAAQDSRDLLLDLAQLEDRQLVSRCLVALKQLQDDRAVVTATQALEHRETQFAAVRYLREFGHPEQLEPIVQAASLNPDLEFQLLAVQTLADWQRLPGWQNRVSEAIAAIHGHSGQPLVWNLSEPLTASMADLLLAQLNAAGQSPDSLQFESAMSMKAEFALGTPAAITLENPKQSNSKSSRIASTLIRVDKITPVEFLGSSDGQLQLWLNGKLISTRPTPGKFQPDSDRVAANLNRGKNLLVARIQPGNARTFRFHLRFRRRSSKAEHEKLVGYALTSRGNPNRGREVFLNAEKSSCSRCHRVGPEGGRIGPDLTGIGRRFSRIHLIESILEPSRSVAPSYSTIVIVLKNGQVMSGIRISESNQMLVLGDNQGKLHQISKPDIEEITTHTVSTMPEGLEKKLTEREFTDLLAYLESLKTTRAD